MFKTYLNLGFDHILDVQGYDHIVFIVALCAIFTIKEWRKLLVLVTAFTIGHSLTLALSALDIVKIDKDLIEFLIPLTILITALLNVIRPPVSRSGIRLHYALALGFGLIHGMGFSNYFRALLSRSQSVVQPLFAFNVGVELGQLVIVALVMLLSYLFVNLFKVPHKQWNIFVSGIAFGIAMTLILK